jgi:hypothetical protein
LYMLHRLDDPVSERYEATKPQLYLEPLVWIHIKMVFVGRAVIGSKGLGKDPSKWCLVDVRLTASERDVDKDVDKGFQVVLKLMEFLPVPTDFDGHELIGSLE